MRSVVALLTLFISLTVSADLLMEDLFDNNNLTNSTQLNGGFYVAGEGTGDVIESGTIAQIKNSSNKNRIYGMLSKNSISSSLISGETKLLTSWLVSDSDLKANTSALIFTWQSGEDFTIEPEIGVNVNLVDQEVQLFLNTTNNILNRISLDPTFGEENDSFSLQVTFSDVGYLVTGNGAFTKTQGGGASTNLLAGSWGATPKSFTDFKVGAVVNANGTNGLIVDVDQVRIETIPEPAVISFIGLFGLGIIMTRRIFGK